VCSATATVYHSPTWGQSCPSPWHSVLDDEQRQSRTQSVNQPRQPFPYGGGSFSRKPQLSAGDAHSTPTGAPSPLPLEQSRTAALSEAQGSMSITRGRLQDLSFDFYGQGSIITLSQETQKSVPPLVWLSLLYLSWLRSLRVMTLARSAAVERIFKRS
jgi:hypothetical protein